MASPWSVDYFKKNIFCQLFSKHSENFLGISTNSKEPQSGKIFWCLVGEVHDAHRFARQAVENGASALVVHKVTPEIEILSQKVTVFLVPDTLLALQDLAKAWRQEFKFPVVGITGSNGKTSTKEFTAKLLTALGLKKVAWSKGSFNNHWGVPFTILATELDSQAAVVEMGMNHKGELALLGEIVKPDIRLCTTVGKTHMGFFKDESEIAEEKKQIYLAPGGFSHLIFNLDNPWTNKMNQEIGAKQGAKVLTFSTTAPSTVQLKVVEVAVDSLKVEGKIGGIPGEACVPVFGVQNVGNLMAAAAVALAFGFDGKEIWKNLSACEGAWGRGQKLIASNGATILFDGYNASPDSYRVLFESLVMLRGFQNKFGVFGEMLELGSHAGAEHFELGRQAARCGFTHLWFWGPSKGDFERGLMSEKYAKKLFVSNSYEESVASELRSVVGQRDLVVVKGSRGMRVEQFVSFLVPHFSK